MKDSDSKIIILKKIILPFPLPIHSQPPHTRFRMACRHRPETRDGLPVPSGPNVGGGGSVGGHAGGYMGCRSWERLDLVFRHPAVKLCPRGSPAIVLVRADHLGAAGWTPFVMEALIASPKRPQVLEQASKHAGAKAA